MTFWLIAGLFMAGALLFIFLPLLRRRKQQAVPRDEMTINVYRDQFVELDADFRNGILSEEQYAQGKQELQMRLLQDVKQAEGGILSANENKLIGKPGVITAAILGLTIPLLAVLLYMQLGSPEGLALNTTPQKMAQSPNEQQAREPAAEAITREKLDVLVEKLVAHLKTQPKDEEGWATLARSYATMERFSEAGDAYAKLLILAPDSPTVLTNYAEVLAMSNNQMLSGKPAELVHRALRLDANHPKALALAGLAEFERKNFRQAEDYWVKLQTLIPADSEMAASVAESIAEAQLLAKNDKGVKTEREANLAPTQALASKNGPPSERNAAAPAASATSGHVSGNVSISPALAARASPGDTLFIFARAKEGPKMPLAILRLQAKHLPASFSLDDNMAMSPAMKLSNFSEVVVGARISKSGNAMPQSGDLQGFSAAVKIGNKAVTVVIDQQVP